MLEVAGAEVLRDPEEVVGGEGAKHSALVLAEVYDSVPRGDVLGFPFGPRTTRTDRAEEWKDRRRREGE